MTTKDRLSTSVLTFDMDVWAGLSYGQHPDQKMDVWELNDLAPRAGWPALLCFADRSQAGASSERFGIQGPLFARKGLLVAHANIRWSAASDWTVLQQDALAAIHRLLGLQINPRRVGLWGIGAGGSLALRAAEELGEEHIRALVSLGAPTTLQGLEMPRLDALPLPEESLFIDDGSPSLRTQQRALSWIAGRLADKQRGSKWKIRRKKR